jgi:hypothetical protein
MSFREQKGSTNKSRGAEHIHVHTSCDRKELVLRLMYIEILLIFGKEIVKRRGDQEISGESKKINYFLPPMSLHEMHWLIRFIFPIN